MNDPAPVKIWNDYDRPHRDLREFLSRIEAAGELLRVARASRELRREVEAKFRDVLSKL